MKRLTFRQKLRQIAASVFYEGVAIPLLWIHGHLFFGLSIHGKENIRVLKKKGGVLVCNHMLTLDCTFVGLLAAPRRPTYTAVAWLFRKKLFGRLIDFLGAVPVPFPPAPEPMRRFLWEMTETVRAGHLICVFPEGNLYRYSTRLHSFRDGAFYIAALAGAPVVPIAVSQRKAKGLRKILRRSLPCLTVTAGAPLYPKPGKKPRESARELRDEAWESMNQILRDATLF